MIGGDRLTLTIEKPAAGGRMIARHGGAVVLVSAAIPGEVVEAEIERVQRGVAWARTVRVLEASPDRTPSGPDWACGGNVFAHVRYDRQIQLKRQIIEDALARIARVPVPDGIAVTPSPIDGYRMRARLHVVDRRLGFFREGTHELCDAGLTRQLLAATVEALQVFERSARGRGLEAVADIEVCENCPADQRALHLVLRDGARPLRVGSFADVEGFTGISSGASGRAPLVLSGTPVVTDTLSLTGAWGAFDVRLSRHAHAFFQGNRFLLRGLVAHVLSAVRPGRVLDLYAGVGLFAVSIAGRGDSTVVAIEGDRIAADDLARNAAHAPRAVDAQHRSVEECLASATPRAYDAVIVDPPRSGMTKHALQGAIALQAEQMVYVSCDVATFARDTRALTDAGYRLDALRAFDLFPNTAHVESVAVFVR